MHCVFGSKNEPRVPRHTHVTGSRIGKLALTPLSQEMFSNLIELSEGAAPLRTKAPHPFTVYTVHSFVARGDYGKSLSTPFLLALSSPSPLSFRFAPPHIASLSFLLALTLIAVVDI